VTTKGHNRYRQRPSFTAWNLRRALAYYRLQVQVLALLRLMGPSTVLQLLEYCRSVASRAPTLEQLRHVLPLLRRLKLVARIDAGPHASYWSLPDPEAVVRSRAAAHEDWRLRELTGSRVAARRRTEKRVRKAASWWVAAPREEWREAVSERWGRC
jgi:hypothetical protein